MSLPEISRRCLSCGAAVRAGGRFCPQCGQAFSEGEQSQMHVAGADAAAASHGEGVVRADDGIESLAARLSAELAGGGAPKTRDVEVRREAAPSTRDVYVPAREEETPLEREGVEENNAAAAVVGAPQLQVVEVVAARDAIAPEAVDDDGVTAGEERGGRVARVRENARGRVESTKVRVGKMRDEALVVLEETPDDSGLRFVLVAVAVFLLFVLFLFFSTSVL